MAFGEHGREQSFEPRIGRSVSLDHAAQLLGVSRRTIYNRIREGRLRTIRTLGGSQRVVVDSFGDSRGTVVDESGTDQPAQLAGPRLAYSR